MRVHSPNRRLLTNFDSFFNDFHPVFATPSGWQPQQDVLEYEDRFEIRLDLPGVPEQDVEVRTEDGVLEIAGERKADDTSEARVLRSGRRHGRFRSTLRLGDAIDVDRIAAVYRDGVLTVTLPKSERAKARQIPVSVN